MIAVVGTGCGSASAIGHGGGHAARARTRDRARPAAVVGRAGVATIHFRGGHETRSFRMREPAGVILLYRISAPGGARIRGSAQLRPLTAPLQIRTFPFSPSSACAHRASRLICTVGEEWCPLPGGTWVVRLQKLSGPPGDVTLRLRVGTPPRRRAT
jgi:hypothetical protein